MRQKLISRCESGEFDGPFRPKRECFSSDDEYLHEVDQHAEKILENEKYFLRIILEATGLLYHPCRHKIVDYIYKRCVRRDYRKLINEFFDFAETIKEDTK